MKPSDRPLIKAYFDSCIESDTTPSYSDFISHHFKFLQGNIDCNDPTEFNNWYNNFVSVAQQYNIKIIKGNAKKVWYELVVPKAAKTCKRSLNQAVVVEDLEGLEKNLAVGEEAICTKFNEFRAVAIEDLKKTGVERSISCDLDKLLAAQGILRVTKTASPLMKEAFGEELLKQFRKEKRLSLFGKPARICSNIKQELDDVLLEYDENRDKDELEEGLFMLKKKTNGATARTLKTIMLLLDHMSEKKGVMTEMRLQSGLITALCHVFKPNTSHDVVGYNKVLFPASVAAKNCRPDIIVEVVSPKALVNVVGEVKCASAPKESVALDLFRLGVFGVEMLFEYNLKSSIVFQAVGNELVFFVCFLFSGFCVMLEVESLILPSTYDEFANFGLQSHKLQNIASLYEMCCVEDSNNAARKWHKFSYDVIKNIYSICSTTRTSTVHRSEASSEV